MIALSKKCVKIYLFLLKSFFPAFVAVTGSVVRSPSPEPAGILAHQNGCRNYTASQLPRTDRVSSL